MSQAERAAKLSLCQWKRLVREMTDIDEALVTVKKGEHIAKLGRDTYVSVCPKLFETSEME